MPTSGRDSGYIFEADIRAYIDQADQRLLDGVSEERDSGNEAGSEAAERGSRHTC